MDADLSHNPSELIKMKERLEVDADLIIGSRYKNGVNVINWPLSRILLSYIASIYVRFITSMPIKDPTSGFVGYKKEVLEVININRIKFVGYAFQIEMKFKAYNLKYKLYEIPIIFTDRKRGESKLNLSIIIKNAKVPVIVDAGIGTASDAAIAMELGCDGVLINTAIAKARNPLMMANSMKHAVIAGRNSYLAGRMKKNFFAKASSTFKGLI